MLTTDPLGYSALHRIEPKVSGLKVDVLIKGLLGSQIIEKMQAMLLRSPSPFFLKPISSRVCYA
jgi:hypothetical protein